MRERWLFNRILTSYTDILDHRLREAEIDKEAANRLPCEAGLNCWGIARTQRGCGLATAACRQPPLDYAFQPQCINLCGIQSQPL
jgi:hypothetical protein